MSVLINGTNGLIQAYDYQVLTTGFSYTFAAGTQTLVINPAGTLAAGTITMPASPSDGMTITFSSTQQITALTLNGNTGQTVVGAPTQLIPNQPLAFIYRATNTTWYAMSGGAGRASSVVIGTSVASTSGTSIDFTGIPSWAKRITVMFAGVSTNNTNGILLQLGTSGGVVSTGYFCTLGLIYSGTAAFVSTSTTGFIVGAPNLASDVNYGSITLSLLGSNSWVAAGNIASTSRSLSTAGGITLGGTLDRVRITSVDTFDAGSINILYE